MDVAYVNYGVSMAAHYLDVPLEAFVNICIHQVSASRYGQNPKAVRAAFGAYLLPTNNIFPGHLLIEANLLPFTRVGDIMINCAALGVPENEFAAWRDSDGALQLSLSLLALKICADRYPGIDELLNHASYIFTAFAAYNMNHAM